MQSSHPTHPGPRACATCAKAKSRCIPSSNTNSAKCERCDRLNKPCSSQKPAPARQRKPVKPTRVSELERRLDHLTSRLEPAAVRAAAAAGARSNEVVPQSTRPRSVSPNRLPRPDVFMALPAIFLESPPARPESSATPVALETPSGIPSPLTRTAQPSEATPGDCLWPAEDEASVLLSQYRRLLAPAFPFIVIPAETTARELRQHRPLLWKAVMMASLHTQGHRQIALGNQIFKEIASSAFVAPRKSLDSLQAMQVFLSWFYYNMNSLQATNILFLCRSICSSLGLGEVPQACRNPDEEARYVDRIRTFLGCYYLVTTVFTTNKRSDALMSTTSLDGCCRYIERKMQHSTDDLVVALVRVHQLAQAIPPAVEPNNCNFYSTHPPLAMIVTSFRQQLSTFHEALPPHIQRNASVQCHYHIAEILLYEVGMTGAAGSYLPHTDRLELLWHCLHATKSFMAVKFAATDDKDKPRFTCMIAHDFLYAFLTCLKLMTLAIPGWDLMLVSKELALEVLVKRQVADMEEIARMRYRNRLGQDGHAYAPDEVQQELAKEDPHYRLAQKLKQLGKQLGEELEAYSSRGTQAATPGTSIMDTTQDLVQGLDESQWADLLDSEIWASVDNPASTGWAYR